MATPELPKLTLLQRFSLQATPTFQVIGYVGKAIIAAALFLKTSVPLFPDTWILLAGGIGALLVGLEKLSVDANKLIQNGTFSFSSIVSTIPKTISDLNAVNKEITAVTASVTQIKNTQVTTDQVIQAAEQLAANGQAVVEAAEAGYQQL